MRHGGGHYREDTAIGKQNYVVWLFFTRSADAVVMMRTWMLDAKGDCEETSKEENCSATGEFYETFVGFSGKTTQHCKENLIKLRKGVESKTKVILQQFVDM